MKLSINFLVLKSNFKTKSCIKKRNTAVDPFFGNWQDIEKLSQNYYLMFDFMINHISRLSLMYQDFQKYHEKSKYKDFFYSLGKILGTSWEKSTQSKRY